MPEREKRFAYCRRMMSEVIDHFDSVDLTPYFLTACDSGKARKSVVYDIDRQSVHQAYCDRHCRIPHVELANQRSLKPMAEQNEPGAVSMIYGFCNSVGGICIEPNRGNLAQRLCTTSAQFWSSALIKIFPPRGTILTRRLKLSLISSRFEKISAWSNSMLLITTVSGR